MVVGARHVDSNAAARVRVACRVVENVGERLGQAQFVAVHLHRDGRLNHFQRVLAGLDIRTRGFDAAVHDGRDVRGLFIHRQVAARDPADVEQIVDDARQLAALSFDDLAHLVVAGLRRVGHALQLHRIADGSQRISELVRKHGDKVVHIRGGQLQ